MDKNIIVTILVIVLIVISAVQTVQLVILKNKIASGTIISGAAVSNVNTQTQNSNPVSTPQMVGGC